MRFFGAARFASEFTLELSYTDCALRWTKYTRFIAYMAMPLCTAIVPCLFMWVYQVRRAGLGEAGQRGCGPRSALCSRCGIPHGVDPVGYDPTILGHS